eukprot:364234-Chlamydomonas_euryale.AAC.20
MQASRDASKSTHVHKALAAHACMQEGKCMPKTWAWLRINMHAGASACTRHWPHMHACMRERIVTCVRSRLSSPSSAPVTLDALSTCTPHKMLACWSAHHTRCWLAGLHTTQDAGLLVCTPHKMLACWSAHHTRCWLAGLHTTRDAGLLVCTPHKIPSMLGPTLVHAHAAWSTSMCDAALKTARPD